MLSSESRLGELGEPVFVRLADRVERALDSLFRKLHDANLLLNEALGLRLGKDTLDELAVGQQQISLAGCTSLFGRRRVGRGRLVRNGLAACINRDRSTDEAEPDRHDGSIEDRHARSNPEVAVPIRADPTDIGNRNVTFWSKWWREVSPDPKIRQYNFGARHDAG